MTENEDYTDLGATTQEAVAIVETSMDIVRTLVPDETLNDQLRQKAVHSTGDIEFQHFIRCQNDLIVAGADESLEALVFERLTHDDEHITRTTLGNLRASAGASGPGSTPYSDLSVLTVRAPVEINAEDVNEIKDE